LTLYLDTSVIVAELTPEAESGRIDAWMRRQSDDGFLISDWVAAEFSAALSIKLRTGQLNNAQRTEALAAFSGLCTVNLTVLPVSREQFHVAARFADQYRLGLRAGDALHLAVCADHDATLCTLDRRLGDAGPTLGIPTILV
jgi:predicted nucleic acid-binding protein